MLMSERKKKFGMWLVLALPWTAGSSSPDDHRVTISPGVHMPLISNGAVTLHTDSSSSDVETLVRETSHRAQLHRARGDSADAATRIYFGSGCFWGRQHDQVTKFEEKKLHRADANITAIGGYAGGHTATGPDGLCCYHNGKNASDYAELGHAEVVQLEIEIDAAGATATSARRRRRAVASAARAAMDVYFASFIELSPGIYAREDIYDQNAGYRALVGLPGGVKSELMVQLRAANLHNMSLVAGVGGDADTFGLNRVWIMNSNVFSFQQAELCLQFHNNQTGHYSSAYGALRSVLERDGRLVDNRCPTNYVC